jgi:hypothetical protein
VFASIAPVLVLLKNPPFIREFSIAEIAPVEILFPRFFPTAVALESSAGDTDGAFPINGSNSSSRYRLYGARHD